MSKQNKKPAQDSISNTGKVLVPGLIAKANTISFSVNELQATDHFFLATDYDIEVDGTQLNILFATHGRFTKSNEYNLAVEISFPLKIAIEFLYRSIWKTNRLGGDESFGEFLTTEIGKYPEIFRGSLDGRTSVGAHTVPNDNRFRKFPSNFMTASMSLDQGMLEFFEAPPSMLSDMTYIKKTRPNSSVKHVISIIIQPTLMLHFFNRAKELLEPFIEYASLNEAR